MEECKIIKSINLRPCLKSNFNRIPPNKRELKNTLGFNKINSSLTSTGYHNLKTPIIIEASENPDEKPAIYVSKVSNINTKVVDDSFSEVYNKSFQDSISLDTSNLSELNLNDSKNIQYGVEISTPELQLEEQNDNLPQFYSLINKVLVILKPETTFWFCGKLKIHILYGSIKIYGATFSSSETLEVYSPRGHSFVGIETEINKSNCDMEKLWEALVPEGVDRSIKSSLTLNIKQCQSGWAVVLLENLTNNLTSFLNDYCSFKLFPKIEDQNFYSWNDVKKAEATLQTNFFFNKAGKQLIINPEWKTRTVDRILNEYFCYQQSINIIFGGKSVGKSTFSRYLVNSIIPKSSVVFVNLDPGQTECTPSRCISVNIIDKPFLGPNFTQLRTPYYQLYIGDINVSNCVASYLEAVKVLVDRIKSDPKISNLPIIVNTMGFCKGLGWKIAVSIIQIFQPTNVIQITSKKAKNNFDKYLTKEVVTQEFSKAIFGFDDQQNILSYNFQRINSEAEMNGNSESMNLEPYQKRDLVMLAYLSQITKERQTRKLFNSITPSLNDTIMHKMSLSSLYLSNTRVPPTHVLLTMIGNIVALCEYNPSDECINSLTDLSSEGPQVLESAEKSAFSTCYGFGIVRTIDFEKKVLYISTPLSHEELKMVNYLVDSLPIPTALLTLDLPNAPYTGIKADLPTSKESRRGYFRMKNQIMQS